MVGERRREGEGTYDSTLDPYVSDAFAMKTMAVVVKKWGGYGRFG